MTNEKRPNGKRHLQGGISKKGKAILVTDRGSPLDCETSRFLHFLDSRLTDGGKAVSHTRPLLFTPRKIPGTTSVRG
jgi:hypothetical protein